MRARIDENEERRTGTFSRSSLEEVDEMELTKNFFNQVQEYEKKLIGEALSLARGNQAKAARLLGLRPTTLNSQIQRLGIDAQTFKRPSRPAPFEEFERFISWRSGRVT